MTSSYLKKAAALLQAPPLHQDPIDDDASTAARAVARVAARPSPV
jgi:hypothetical protein